MSEYERQQEWSRLVEHILRRIAFRERYGDKESILGLIDALDSFELGAEDILLDTFDALRVIEERYDKTLVWVPRNWCPETTVYNTYQEKHQFSET